MYPNTRSFLGGTPRLLSKERFIPPVSSCCKSHLNQLMGPTIDRSEDGMCFFASFLELLSWNWHTALHFKCSLMLNFEEVFLFLTSGCMHVFLAGTILICIYLLVFFSFKIARHRMFPSNCNDQNPALLHIIYKWGINFLSLNFMFFTFE